MRWAIIQQKVRVLTYKNIIFTNLKKKKSRKEETKFQQCTAWLPKLNLIEKGFRLLIAYKLFQSVENKVILG